jgi:hypothetical protein
VPQADHERIFQAFEQSANTSTQGHIGTGLGLTISRELARAMGGDVSCRHAPGGGACFDFTLRCVPMPAPEGPNTPTGALLALATLLPGAPKQLLLSGFVASFAAKLGDTFGSEIGKRWGRSTVSLSQWKPVPPGTDGAVSLEGTLASLVGSLLFSAVGWALKLIPAGQIPLITAVAFFACLIESLIGAELQPRVSWLSNEAVNGLLTVIAAGLAMVLLH